MAWFKVDDSFHVHPDVVRLLEAKGGGAAVGLWTIAGSYCAQLLTNGLLPSSLVRRWGFTKKHADLLVSVGLWERTEDGYQFRNWLKYQPSKASVREKREAAKERMKRVRSREQHGEQAANVHQPRPDPSRPVEREHEALSSALCQEFSEHYRAWAFEADRDATVLRGEGLTAAVERAQAVAQRHGCDFGAAVRRLMASAHERAQRTGQGVGLALRDCEVPKPASRANGQSMAEWQRQQEELEANGPAYLRDVSEGAANG